MVHAGSGKSPFDGSVEDDRLWPSGIAVSSTLRSGLLDQRRLALAIGFVRFWQRDSRRRCPAFFSGCAPLVLRPGSSTVCEQAMGIDGISTSEVSRLAAELDSNVRDFRERPLDAGPHRYLWINALTQRVREGGRVVNVSAVMARAATQTGAGRSSASSK